MNDLPEKLREFAAQIEASTDFPKVPREDIDVCEAARMLVAEGIKATINIDLEVDPNKKPTLRFCVNLDDFNICYSDRYCSAKTLRTTVELAIAKHKVATERAADDEEPAPIEAAQAAVDGLVAEPF